MRIPFVLLPPVLSDDVYRLRWDGRVLASGRDPYRHPPSHPSLRGLRDAEFAKINHPDVPTVYGPLAEGLLGLLALSPAKASLVSLKATAALFDLVTVASLEALGGFGPVAAFLYAVHPLAVVETAGEGHLDGAAVALLLAGSALLARGRAIPGALAVAAAGLVKITPLAAAPALLRSARGTAIVLAAGLFTLAHAPFAASGGPLRGLTTYARSWEGNGAVYPELVGALKAVHAAAHTKRLYGRVKAVLGHPALLDRAWSFFYDELLARVLLGVAFLASLGWVLTRVADPLRAAGLSLGALLFFSPTLHPWYLLEVLPFAFLFRWTSVAWVAGAAPLVYLTALTPGAVRAIEFLPAAVLYLAVDRRNS